MGLMGYEIPVHASFIMGFFNIFGMYVVLVHTLHYTLGLVRLEVSA
jgi:hypothetical protein